MNTLRFALSTAVFAAVCAVSAAPGRTFYVDAQKGADANPGTTEKPFATPTRARDAVRALKKQNAFPAGGVEVVLEGRFNSVSQTLLDLDKNDGGVSKEAPVVWRAGAKGAFFSGACRLSAADFHPADEAARARLKPDVRGKVLACDLAAKGVAPLKPLPATFGTFTEMELVSGGQAQTLARYPNAGWLEITNVVDRGVAPCDRSVSEWEFGVRGGTFAWSDEEPARWNVAEGVYVYGFWCYDWASDTLRVAKIDGDKKTITTEGIHRYGIGKPSKWAQAKPRYFVYNLLEELDAPGEWYVDRAKRILYYLPGPEGVDDVALSLAKKPLVSVVGARHVVVKGLDFKYSTGRAVQVAFAEDVALDGLTCAWLSADAISVWAGKDVTIANCKLDRIGGTGLSVHGGERKTLTKCGHRVVGNDVGRCGRLARIGGKCLSFGGCGVTVERNYFHDTPYIAVAYGGNEHLMQYNEIECAMLEAGDGAGIYTGRDWGSRGNVLRWNYLHHFGKDGVELRAAQGVPSGFEALAKDVMVEGIYLDDCDSGETIYGNLFYKTGRAMFTGGGRDNIWTENLVVDCRTAAHFDVRGLQRARPGSGIKDGWDLLAKIEAMAYTNEPWCSRYPQLLGIMQKEPLLPIGTAYSNNVAVSCGHFFSSWKAATTFLQQRSPNAGNASVNPKDATDAKDYPQTNAVLRAKVEIVRDDALAAAAANPVALQDAAPFRARYPRFTRIPVEQIGLPGRRISEPPCAPAPGK